MGPPLISQMPLNGEAAATGNGIHEGGEDGAVPVIPATTTEVDPALLAEDNSPLYFCPGFVDHNGYFHANRKCALRIGRP